MKIYKILSLLIFRNCILRNFYTLLFLLGITPVLQMGAREGWGSFIIYFLVRNQTAFWGRLLLLGETQHWCWMMYLVRAGNFEVISEEFSHIWNYEIPSIRISFLSTSHLVFLPPNLHSSNPNFRLLIAFFGIIWRTANIFSIKVIFLF